MNTSATGGPLQPADATPPLSGQALLVFLQNWLAPLCALDGSLVRPRWQDEPSNIPDAGTQWMAFGFVGDENADTYPYVEESSDGLSSQMQRHEELEMLCSFYDTGVTGEADATSRLLRDNLGIPQNWEPLYSQGFALAHVGSRRQAPRVLSNRWVYRVDLPVTVRCQIQRKYEVLSVLSMQGTLYTDSGLSFPLAASGG